MKKTFLAKRNALLSASSFTLGLVVVGAGLLIALLRIVAPNTFLILAVPLANAGKAVMYRLEESVQGFGDTLALARENERLVLENQALTYENRVLIERLRDVASVAHGREEIVASVVLRPPESAYDTLVLGEGSDAGVREGMGVYVGSLPLGRITAAYADFSRATLFSSSGTRVSGWVGEKREPIELAGQGGGAVEAKLPRGVAVQVGDLVYLGGAQNVPFGSVVRVDDDPAAPLISVRIVPLINIFSLTTVSVRESGSALKESVTEAP